MINNTIYWDFNNVEQFNLMSIMTTNWFIFRMIQLNWIPNDILFDSINDSITSF